MAARTYKATRANLHHRREARLMLHMSLIQQVAQLSLPRSRWILMTMSRISSSTSPGSAAKSSPGCGAVLLRFRGWGVRYAPPYSTGFHEPELKDSTLVRLP